ncbi:MAG: choice-of-anchor Q domain-containing protein [Desulforhopalus sp.]
MKIPKTSNRKIRGDLMAVLISFSLVMFFFTSAQALTLNVVDKGGSAVATTYRWLIEEDKTYHVQLDNDGTVLRDGTGAPVLDPNWRVGPDGVLGGGDDDPLRNTLSVSFHRSYMPVVTNSSLVDIADFTPVAGKNYFISVLPALGSGYSMGGAAFSADDASVTVYLGESPIPTAQISIFVHEDIAPINGVWDEGEQGLEGFTLVLEDAGGKYGASAGTQSTDVYGNPLCTTYLPNGDIDVLGAGCTTGPDGRIIVKNLAPAKYGVVMVPPSGSTYVQTSTIEGTILIDAWVKANEPPFFGEFGPPGPHASVGFAPANEATPYIDTVALNGTTNIQGQVVNLHLSRSPNSTFELGGPFPHTTPWVGLNDAAGGVLGQGLYAAITTDGPNGSGYFNIPSVPAGEYNLVIWDNNLDLVIGKSTVIIDADGNCNGGTGCDLGQVGVFQWFTRLENWVYRDENGNNYADAEAGEGIPEQNVNLRWRDGTIYQAFPTDSEGFVPFDEAFPFFSWLVAEVDFARFKATGVTVTVDDGGAIPTGLDPDWTFGGNVNPQDQTSPTDPDSDISTAFFRHESGPVLSQGFQGFLGQTSVLQWSKDLYGPGENGGISGVVMYAVTRAEDDPELAAAEPWEPGIPGVTVNLYASDGNGNVVGPALATTTSDSWDDNLPTNCQYGTNGPIGLDPFSFRGVATDCYDGLRNWNQVRPAVFDGGYAFGPQFDLADYPGGFPSWIQESTTDANIGYMVEGTYIVEVIPPTGYQVIKSEDRNVDFGEEYAQPLLLPAPCVGTPYVVGDFLTLFPGVAAPLAGQTLNGCERKEVVVTTNDNPIIGTNSAADFSLFTEVPISAHIIGFILDDTANEFDPASPQFGEKFAPPFLPVSIRDWKGVEISRTISDENGVYNALVPSTFTTNLPAPSGMAPNMLTTCMNAKTLPDGSPDPLHNPQYSQFCYTFQYMPGSTTYLDTPVVPVAAFAGPDQFPLDCELSNATPRIASVSVVNNDVGGGPYVPARTNGTVLGNRNIEILSMGIVDVPNPAYDGLEGTQPKTITRNYRFGQTQGTVTIGDVNIPIINWTGNRIFAQIPRNTDLGTTGAQQLIVTAANGKSTVTGVSMQVGLRAGSNVVVVSPSGPITSIQEAINGAGNNDLILVGPGTYNENVIMWKPVQLQGWGEGSTYIDAIKTQTNQLGDWRTLAENLLTGNGTGPCTGGIPCVDRIPGQELGFGGIEPDTFFSEEGAGVFVLASQKGTSKFAYGRNRGARIDGFTISGADTGGGVVVNGYANYLEISNLKIANNSAFYAAGIRVGHPLVSLNEIPTDAENDFVKIHHNTVVQNGGLDGAGGGIGVHTGSDSYAVNNNYVCGNFTTADGAGIAHFGLSDNGVISENTVIFNENFNQGAPTNGGGVLVAGKPALAIGGLSDGSGSVQIIGNLIQGNAAGAGDGGGIQLSRVNGQDIIPVGTNLTSTYVIDIINNIIVNNVSTLSGGGIAIQDALNVNILNNTIAQNDNASTAGAAFSPGVPTQSNPQPGAGVAARAHLDIDFPGATADPGYSNPLMQNNIVWNNRMFYWLLDDSTPTDVRTGLCPDIGGAVMLDPACGTTPVFEDLAVLGTGDAADVLTCTDCQLSSDADPLFVAASFNGSRETTTFLPETNTSIAAPPALDEGGNFIRLRYGPLTQTRNYHIEAGSPVIDASTSGVANDFDLDARPAGGDYDIGADEFIPVQ